MNLMSPGIGYGQHFPLLCLVDMVDQFPDPPRECVLVKVSFVALLEGDDEQLLVPALVLGFSQLDLESLDWTKRVILQHLQS